MSRSKNCSFYKMKYERLPQDQQQSERYPIKGAIVCFLLTLQFSSFAIMRTHLSVDRSDSTILLHAEILKLIVSIGMLMKGKGKGSIMRSMHDIHLSLIPFMCFCAMNMISLWCLRKVSASTFVVIMQMKLVFTAIFSRIILSRSLDPAQVGILLTIITGVISVSLQESMSGTEASNFIAMGGLLFETLLSGFSGV